MKSSECDDRSRDHDDGDDGNGDDEECTCLTAFLSVLLLHDAVELLACVARADLFVQISLLIRIRNLS